MNIRGAVDNYDRKTTTHIVAYLDILGVASRMKIDNQIEPLNKLYNLYKHNIDYIGKEKGIERYADIRYRIFSDNIIIAKELSSDKAQRSCDIENLFYCVSNFSHSAIGDGVGWLLRGGITIGEFYINDTIIWGSALLRAYELENTIANYPRIVIDSSILAEFDSRKKPSDYTDPADFVRKDFDGIHYLNYMNTWHFAGQFVKNGFEKMKAEAKKPDGTYSDKIYQKLVWHMNYINSELDKKNERKDKKYRLTMD